MAALLFAATVFAIGAGVVIALFAVFTRRRALRNIATVATLIVCIGYLGALLLVSLLGKPQVLATGAAKEFCGFYLDCHIHAAVVGVRRVSSVSDRIADGSFLIVRTRVFSDARNHSIKMRLLEPKVAVVDSNGTAFQRNTAIESLLPTASAGLGADITTDSPIEKDLVFEVPADSNGLRMDIAEGYAIDWVLESFIIGDEDSLLHPRTTFQIDQERNGN